MSGLLPQQQQRLAAARQAIDDIESKAQLLRHRREGGGANAAAEPSAAAAAMRRDLLRGLGELDAVRRFLHDGINASNQDYLDHGTRDAAVHTALEQGLSDLEQVRVNLTATLQESAAVGGGVPQMKAGGGIAPPSRAALKPQHGNVAGATNVASEQPATKSAAPAAAQRPPRPMSATVHRPPGTGGALPTGSTSSTFGAAPPHVPNVAFGSRTTQLPPPPPPAPPATPPSAAAAAAPPSQRPGQPSGMRPRPSSAPARRATGQAEPSTPPGHSGEGDATTYHQKAATEGTAPQTTSPGTQHQWSRYQEWAQQVMSRVHSRRVTKYRHMLGGGNGPAASAPTAPPAAPTTVPLQPSHGSFSFTPPQPAATGAAATVTQTSYAAPPTAAAIDPAAKPRPTRPMSATAAGNGLNGVRRVQTATTILRPASAGSQRSASASGAAAPSVDGSKLFHHEAQGLREQGNVLFQQKRYREAAEAYGKAIHLEPQSDALYCNRAAAYLMMSRFTDALSDAQKAIDIDPAHVKAHWRAAKACLYLGHTDQARVLYGTAAKLSENPQDTESINVELRTTETVDRCRRSLRLREFQEAVKLADQVLEVFPPTGPCSSPWQCLRAEAMLSLDPTEALTYLTTVNQQDPNSAEAWFLRAKAVFYTSHDAAGTTAAIGFAQRARELDAKHGKAVALVSCIETFAKLRDDGNNAYAAGRWHEAYTAYTKCLSVDPFNASLKAIILCNRSAVCIQCEKWKDALDDVNQSISLNGNNAKAFTRRARIEQQQGNLDAAVRDLQLAAQLFPSSENQERLAQAIEQQRQQQQQQQQRSAAGGSSFRFFSFGGGGAGGARRPQSASTGGSRAPPPTSTQAAGPSPYVVLGVERHCDERALVKAYREAALKWHPDKWAAASDTEKVVAESTFKNVSAAYNVLRDPAKRRQYDLGQAGLF